MMYAYDEMYLNDAMRNLGGSILSMAHKQKL